MHLRILIFLQIFSSNFGLTHTALVCDSALGLQTHTIPNARITASSYSGPIRLTDSRDTYAPWQGRLRNNKIWCADRQQQNDQQWLQVDLGETMVVSGVATQGKGTQWVTFFTLEYSHDGDYWYDYKEGSTSSVKVIKGNADGAKIVRHNFISHFSARFVRFRPISWYTSRDVCDVLYVCMKVELYGCKVCGKALGMENGDIRNEQISASSSSMLSQADFPPWRGRVNIGTRIWCAHQDKQDKNQWLQIDLSRVMTVTAVATQGHWERRTTSYYVMYSTDAKTWRMPQNETFSGNTDESSIVKHSLDHPVLARYVRFNPQTWRSFTGDGNSVHVCLRTELYGCERAERPKILKHLKNETYEIGDKVVLTCTYSGELFPIITWTKHGSRDIPSSDLSHNAAVLTITNVTIYHTGRYRCTVENIFGRDFTESTVTIQEPPRILQAPRNITANTSSTVSFDCQVRGEPWPSVTWYKEEKIVGSGCPLIIQNVNADHSGVYKCLVHNSLGQSSKAEAHLTVNYLPRIHDTRLTHTIKRAYIGDTVLLDCPVNAYPAPRYSWTKDGVNVTVNMQESFMVLNVDSEYVYGKYDCRAANMMGSTHVTVELKPTPQKLAYAPKLYEDSLNSTSLYAMLNETIFIFCPIKSNPEPDIAWFKDGIVLHPPIEDGAQSGVVLKIEVHDEAFGVYTCNASNFLGYEATEIEVKPIPIMTVSQPRTEALQSKQEKPLTILLTVGISVGILIVIAIFALAWALVRRSEDSRMRRFRQPLTNTTSNLIVSEEFISMNSRSNDMYQEVQSLTNEDSAKYKNCEGDSMTSSNIYEPQ